MAANALKIFKKNILARFGVPQSIMKNNGTQFIDRKFENLLEEFKIKHHFSLFEHPQTNGQAETSNFVLVRGFKRRL